MATGVLMLVHTDKVISAAQVEELADKMLAHLPLNIENFYRAGPLVFYDREDFAYMPTADEAKETGFWLNVNLSKDYYFPGYERGDIELFVSPRDNFLCYHEGVSHQPYPPSKSDEAREQHSQVRDDL